MKKIRVIIICICFDYRGFGQSRVIECVYPHIDNSIIIKKISILPLLENYQYDSTVIHYDGNVINGKVRNVPNIVDKIIENKPDIVHFHGIWTMSLYSINTLVMHNIGVIVSLHGMLDSFVLRKNYFRKKLFSIFIQKKSLRNSSIVHALHNKEATDLSRYLSQKRVPPIVVIPNGAEALADVKDRKDNSMIEFLWTGQLVKRKNVYRLLNAWTNVIRDSELRIKLTIAGYGSNLIFDKIKIISKKTKNIELIKNPDRDEIKCLIGRSDFYISTSLSEGQPLAVLEALASGRPCIVSSKCNLEIIKKFNLGWIADSRDELIERRKMARYITIEQYAAKATDCIKIVHSYHNWNTIGSEMGNVYASVYNKMLRIRKKKNPG